MRTRVALILTILGLAMAVTAAPAAAGGALIDIQVTKSALPTSAVAGSNITYTIHVTNAGTLGTFATLGDATPADTTFVSMTSPAGWTATTPAPGGTGPISATRTATAFPPSSQDFTLVVNINPGTPVGTIITNTATVGPGVGDIDPDPTNNSATATTTVVAAPPATPAASLADAATAPPATGRPLAPLGLGLLMIGLLGVLLVANARGVARRR